MKNFKNGCALAALMVSASVVAEDSYSPYAGKSYPQNVYFGDTHLHTNMSIDANRLGNEGASPDDAYRFAKGETQTAHNGMKVRLRTPLDFLVVADHAENTGVMKRLTEADPSLLSTEIGKYWYKLIQENPVPVKDILSSDSTEPYQKVMDFLLKGKGFAYWKGWGSKPDGAGYVGGDAFRRSVWAEIGANAERHNDPGKFTAFIGYEWTGTDTGQHGNGNLHRVVIYKDGPDKTNALLPFSAIDSRDPEDLWKYLETYSKKTGGDVLAISHNSNQSNGAAFSVMTLDGEPLNRAYAETRNRWEPLVEVTQIKGDSETHPILSPDDEFADYETWNSGSGPSYKGVKTAGWEERKKGEYVRSALKLGIGQKAVLGVNPFKFGMIGSTDAHTSLSAVEENNYWNAAVLREPSKYRLKLPAYHAASGYAAVWAEENTRESLFAAMKRRETYATTGPRMTVRFFGGWAYDKDDAHRPDLAKLGYAGGVPMGGDLTAAPKGKAPSFLIRAVKDADGANLDRVQVIKGWRSADGELHEKIYNVALSGGRRDEGSKTEPVGSTVDVKEASYANTIGTPELATVWRDPDFKTDELAFYYVRVLEIPTPRWTAYDAKYFGLKNIPDEVPMVTQERAYTSPIWYTP